MTALLKTDEGEVEAELEIVGKEGMSMSSPRPGET